MELNVVYIGFIFFSIYVFIYRNKFKSWDEIETTDKFLPAMAVIFLIIFGFFSFLRLLGNL